MPFDLDAAKEFIETNIPIHRPQYIHDNEEVSLNPAYEDITNTDSYLIEGEIRIWALRGDMILATGIKNAYQSRFDYYELQNAFFKSTKHLNIHDRYGHPSLTYSNNIDVGAYYAGYLKLIGNRLKVFLASGRFFVSSYTKAQVNILEKYLAHQFHRAYGVDSVTFYHGMRSYNTYENEEAYYEHLGIFFKEDRRQELEEELQRHYQI
jgi:hypothetical protein